MDEKNDLINKTDELGGNSGPNNSISDVNNTPVAKSDEISDAHGAEAAKPSDDSVTNKQDANAAGDAHYKARKKAVAKRSLSTPAGHAGVNSIRW